MFSVAARFAAVHWLVIKTDGPARQTESGNMIMQRGACRGYIHPLLHRCTEQQNSLSRLEIICRQFNEVSAESQSGDVRANTFADTENSHPGWMQDWEHRAPGFALQRSEMARTEEVKLQRKECAGPVVVLGLFQ